MELNGLLMPHKTDLEEVRLRAGFLVLIDAPFIGLRVFLQDERQINNPALPGAWRCLNTADSWDSLMKMDAGSRLMYGVN